MPGEIKGIDATTQQIAALAEIGRQIRQSGDIRRINQHKDEMIRLRLLAKGLGAHLEMLNAAWKEALQDRRAIGRMLIEMKEKGQRQPGGRPPKKPSLDAMVIPDLDDLGLTLSESSRSQALAYIPDETLANAIEAVEKNGGELVTRHFIEIGQWFKKHKDDAQEEEQTDEEEADEHPEQEQEQEAEAEGAEGAEEEESPAIRRGQQAWNDILQGYFRIVNSIHEMGGAVALVEGWKADAVREFAGTFQLVTDKLGEIRDQLRRIADEGH
jgi:hypothetical protein